MKFAKSCKIFLLAVVTALICMSVLAFTSGTERAFAASPDKHFNTTETVLEYKENNLVATVQNGAEIKLKNKLAVNALEFDTAISSTVTKVTVTLEYDSFYANGVAKDFTASEVTLDKKIESVLVISVGDVIALDFNGVTSNIVKNENLKIGFTTQNGVLSAKVNDEILANVNDYYKIAGKDKNVASITFNFETSASSTFTVKSIDQMTTATGAFEDKYKQTFELEQDGELKMSAYPVVSIADNLITGSANELVMLDSIGATLIVNAYSFLGNVESDDLFLTKVSEGTNGGSIYLENAQKPKFIQFNKTENVTEDYMVFGVASEDETLGVVPYAEYAVKVISHEGTDVAPAYSVVDDGSGNMIAKDQTAYKAFLKALEDELDGVRLGDEITIPSLKEFITDDITPYNTLTHTLYYKTPSSATGNTSSWNFTINEAGDYLFYVTFTDNNGNAMDVDKFFEVDENDENNITYGDYKAFIFSFNVQDDEPFYVTEAEASEQGKGYVNIKYKVKPFDIEASKYNTSYKLFYNANVDATANDEGWVLVEVGDNYTEEEIAKIAYDGQRSFVPDKKGAYMIECTVVSTNEVKSAVATAVVTIDGDMTTVKPDNQWFQKNVVPLAFLFAGTVFLVILLVLIFKKPKEVVEETDTKQTKK